MRNSTLQTKALITAVQNKKLHELIELCSKYGQACYNDDATFLEVLKALGIPGFDPDKFFYSRADIRTISDREAALKAIVKGYITRTSVNYHLSTLRRVGTATLDLYDPQLIRDQTSCIVFTIQSEYPTVFFGYPDEENILDEDSIRKLTTFINQNGFQQIEEIGQELDYKLSATGFILNGTTKSVFDVVRAAIQIGLKDRTTINVEIERQEFGLCIGWIEPTVEPPRQLFRTVEEYEKEYNTLAKNSNEWQYRYDFETLEECESMIKGIYAKMAYLCVFDDTRHECRTPEFSNRNTNASIYSIHGMLPKENCRVTVVTKTHSTRVYTIRKIFVTPTNVEEQLDKCKKDIATYIFDHMRKIGLEKIKSTTLPTKKVPETDWELEGMLRSLKGSEFQFTMRERQSTIIIMIQHYTFVPGL